MAKANRTHVAAAAASVGNLKNALAEYSAKSTPNVENKVSNPTPKRGNKVQPSNVVPIGIPVTLSKSDQKLVKSASQMMGENLAIEASELAYAQQSAWKTHFASVLAMDKDGIKFYRISLQRQKEARQLSGEFTPSAEARLSECMAIAKAAELGMTPDAAVERHLSVAPQDSKKITELADLSHAQLVSAAVQFKQAAAVSAAAAEGVAAPKKQGRPAATSIQKFGLYMKANIPAADWIACRDLLNKMIKESAN